MKHTPTPLVCPFCGSIPEIGHAKITHCSLHGDPAQEIFVRCKKHECVARPKVSAGDVYNGGLEKARQEAIEKWNVRVPVNSHDELLEANQAMQAALNQIADYATCEDDWTDDLESVCDIAKKALVELGMKTIEKSIADVEQR